MRKSFLFLLLISCFTTSFFAQQFDLSADMRSRYENQYGYLKLRTPGQKATSFVSQRTRLNFDSKDTKLNFRLSLQNVREWGQDEGASLGRNSSSMYEAWAEVIVSKKISLKLGRQELVYDDQRIFGNIDWRQEGRTHDAFLLKYKVNKNHRLDFGLAYDADSYPRRHPIYGNEAGYIGFQHIWYHGDIGKFGVSVLALNRVLEYLKVSNPSGREKVINNMQTLGTRLTFKSGKFSADASTYFQTGKAFGRNVDALYYAGNAAYKLGNFELGLGMEYLSGKDTDDRSDITKNFTLPFGGNHRLNGAMDYFATGGYGTSGLRDVYARMSYENDKFSVKASPHLFSTVGKVYYRREELSRNLGMEIDLEASYKLSKNVSIEAGYSQMFATETMERLRRGDKDIRNSWGWVSFTFKPKLISYKTPKK